MGAAGDVSHKHRQRNDQCKPITYFADAVKKFAHGYLSSLYAARL